MGEVIRFRKPRKGTIRGAAREMLTSALDEHPKPVAVMIVVLAADGRFAYRNASYEGLIHDFDRLARAEAILQREKLSLLD
jgi:hypothetical protein